MTAPPATRWPLLLLAAVIFAALWWPLRFLCDDAFIVFRYVGNAMAGHGLVWNPPPFLPVEGYTSCLWAVLLWGVWAGLGVEPPVAVHALGLGCGLGALVVVAALARRLRLPAWGTGLVLLGMATSVTLVTWCSGGLETPLFVLVLLWWVLAALRLPARPAAAPLAHAMLAAAVLALVRPDGYLFVAATGGLGLWQLRHPGGRIGRVLAMLLPVLPVVAHLLWRRGFYGEWLPNTYFAKVGGAFPEAGWRYAASFALEHGLWLLPLLLLAGFVPLVRRRPAADAGACARAGLALAATAVALHCAYYTVQIGGDHFGYRVYAQLVPLLFLLGGAAAARARRGIGPVLLAWFVVASWTPWLHLWMSRDTDPRTVHRFAPEAPAWLRPVVREYDRWQAWLRLRHVGQRRAQHAAVQQTLAQLFPEREIGAALGPDGFPVREVLTAGVPGWRLPNVFVIDQLGLNDWVVARTPPPAPARVPPRADVAALFPTFDVDGDGWLGRDELERCLVRLQPYLADDAEQQRLLSGLLLMVHARERDDALGPAEFTEVPESFLNVRGMAHERVAPPGYVESFRPNVQVAAGRAWVVERAEPLTAEEIRAVEARWREWVRLARR